MGNFRRPRPTPRTTLNREIQMDSNHRAFVMPLADLHVPGTGDEERDLIARALFTIEAQIGERMGWDAPPTLMALVKLGGGTGPISGRLIPYAAWMAGGETPADDLAMLAACFPAPTVFHRPGAPAQAPAGLVGFALMCESWGLFHDEVNPLHEVAARAGLRTFRDDPARMEARNVLAVDVHGHAYSVLRRRGQDTPSLTHRADPGELGNITRHLASLTRAALAGAFPYERL